MQFRILSHAGLEVSHAGKTLICDPWVVGSTHWRSWWNYPPVSRELVASLKPDYIYLTHIHWDHFQGISLRRFDRETPVIIPFAPGPRMRRDLESMGFNNIVELRHGESMQLADDFVITCYHFHIFLDSALVIQGGSWTLLNANDCKLMGAPLQQVLRGHPRIDFVFRSHSSANSRLCYEIIDDETAEVDDTSRYIRDFYLFAKSSGARYAIPFASNSCYLHKDVYHFNDLAMTPLMVKEFFDAHQIEDPEVKVMVSGDRWSEQDGFEIQSHDFFENRDRRVEQYREEVKPKLEKTYEREARATMNLTTMERYFSPAFDAMPWLFRRLFRDHPVLYVLHGGERVFRFRVDIFNKRVEEVESHDDASDPIQIHTNAAIMRHCMAANLFTHLSISKRVRYRVTAEQKFRVTLLNLFFNFYEYEMLPLKALLSKRFVSAWLPRWREGLVYLRIAGFLIARRGFDASRHLPVKSVPAVQR
jgi:UDP-MurNAc hydroxylase